MKRVLLFLFITLSCKGAGLVNGTLSPPSVTLGNVTNVVNTRGSQINQMSPVGGNNGVTDATNAVPLFDGQLGISYYGGGGRSNIYMWSSIGSTPVAGSQPWGASFSFPAGLGQIGLQNSMANPNPLTFINWYLNGNTNAMSKEYIQPGGPGTGLIDALWYFWNMNPYSDGMLSLPMVGTNVIGSLLTTNSDGVPIYIQDQFGIQLGTIPDANLAGETNEAGSYNLLTGAGNFPFYISFNGSYGGKAGQYYYFGWDQRYFTNNSIHAAVHIPILTAGVFTFTNKNNVDALFIDQINGQLTNQGGLVTGTGAVIINGNRVGAEGIFGFNCNSNATFNTISGNNAAWTFDSGGSHRLGFWAVNGQFTKMAHGSATPFTITMNTSSSDILNNQSGSQSDELTIDAAHNVNVVGGILVVTNSNGSVGMTATNHAPTFTQVGGNTGMLFWNSNGVPYVSLGSNGVISTLRILGVSN